MGHPRPRGGLDGEPRPRRAAGLARHGRLGGPADDIVAATVEALIHALQHAHPTRIEGGPLWLEAGVVAGTGARHVEIALRPGGATAADELPPPVRDLTAAVDVRPTGGPAWDSHVLLRSHPDP